MSRYGGEEIELSDPDNSHNQRPAAPKLRGYLYVKHNPTSKKSRVRILSKVRNHFFLKIIYLLNITSHMIKNEQLHNRTVLKAPFLLFFLEYLFFALSHIHYPFL